MNLKKTVLVYLPLDPNKAKLENLPVKLPILAEDFEKVVKENKLSVDVILRGLEAQVKTGKDLDYYLSYYLYLLYDRARDAINSRNFKRAKEYLEEAVKYKKDYRYPFHLGIIEREEGNLESSELLLKEAISLNDDFIPARLELARTLLQKEETDEAIETCKDIIQIDPKFPLAYIVMGDAYLKVGDAKASLALYQQALAIDKDLPAVHWRIGVAANLLQKFSLAEQEFKKSISKGEGGWQARYNLSYALYRLGKASEALEVLKALWEEGVENAEVLTELVIIQKLLGLYEEALDYVEKGQDMGIEEKGFLLASVDIYAFNHLLNKALDVCVQHKEDEFEARRKLIELESKCQKSIPNFLELIEKIDFKDEALKKRLEKVKAGALPNEETFFEEVVNVFPKVVKEYGKCPYISERLLTQSAIALTGSMEVVGLFLFLYRIYLRKHVMGEGTAFALESASVSVVDISWRVGKELSKAFESDYYDLEEEAPKEMKSPSEAAVFFAMALHLLDGHPNPINFLSLLGTSKLKMDVLEILIS
jgi:tetratricopeptide (TPR) repeat protein